MKAKWPIINAILVAVAAFGVLAAGRIGENLVYYWSPSDLTKAGDKAYGASIRLGGMVAQGTLQSNGTNTQFVVTDGKANVMVRSKAVPPQMLREHIGVVVEGTMTREGYFEGTRLMVSHNNEYKTPKDHPKVPKTEPEK
jgi:cytochrome c-type biogenesis protein CcmE